MTLHFLDLYADDSTMFASGFKLSEIQVILQTDLDSVAKWCILNNMSIHPKKSKCMTIGTRQRLQNINQLTLKVNETFLENVTAQKVLGVFIDNTLNWRSHIDYVCKKLNSKIQLLKRVLYFLTDDMKSLFYNSYILPVFDYCCTIWGKDNKSYINKINNLQKRAAKIILNKPTRFPTAGLYKQLNWLSFSDRCKYYSAVLVYKTKNDMAPSYICELLIFSKNKHYSLRSIMHNDLVLNRKPRTNLFKDTFAHYSMNVWNNIPTFIKTSSSLKSFKYQYKCFLIDSSD